MADVDDDYFEAAPPRRQFKGPSTTEGEPIPASKLRPSYNDEPLYEEDEEVDFDLEEEQGRRPQGGAPHYDPQQGRPPVNNGGAFHNPTYSHAPEDINNVVEDKQHRANVQQQQAPPAAMAATQGSRSNPEPDDLPNYNKPKKPFILSKDIAVLKTYKATLAVWIAAGTSLASFFFFVVAYSSVGWAVVDSTDRDNRVIYRELGLWQTCHSDVGCRYLGSTEIAASVRAAEAFATLSLLFILGGIAMTAVYIACAHFPGDVELKAGRAAMLARAICAFCLFLTITIYGAGYADGLYTGPQYRGRLSWAYGFSTIAFFLELAGTAFTALEVLYFVKHQRKNVYEEYE